MASNLKGQSPLHIVSGGVRLVLPPVQVLDNIWTLHQILEEVVNDWHRAVQPYETRIAAGGESADYVSCVAFVELQPTFLKCLFSYVFFFVATDQAYGIIYANLNRANKLASSKVKHAKPPGRTPLVEKAKLIRDWSIAHFPLEKASTIDAAAAMSWTPMSLSMPKDGAWNLKSLTFGEFHLSCSNECGDKVQSRDLEVQGLDALHHDCLSYLEAYDKVCIDYLAELRIVVNATTMAGAMSETTAKGAS